MGRHLTGPLLVLLAAVLFVAWRMGEDRRQEPASAFDPRAATVVMTRSPAPPAKPRRPAEKPSTVVLKRTNQVEYQVQGSDEWQPVFGQRRLAPGDLIRTNRTGKAQITIPEANTMLVIGPETVLRVGKPGFLGLRSGHIRAEVHQPPVSLRTPTTRLTGVHGVASITVHRDYTEVFPMDGRWTVAGKDLEPGLRHRFPR